MVAMANTSRNVNRLPFEIAYKVGDVLGHPVKGKRLVPQASVASNLEHIINIIFPNNWNI